jgi:hypothetical protein
VKFAYALAQKCALCLSFRLRFIEWGFRLGEGVPAQINSKSKISPNFSLIEIKTPLNPLKFPYKGEIP